MPFDDEPPEKKDNLQIEIQWNFFKREKKYAAVLVKHLKLRLNQISERQFQKKEFYI